MAKKWTEKEENFLRNNFEKMGNKDLAGKLDVSIDSIESKLRRLKLKRGKIQKAAKAAKPSAAAPAIKTKNQRATRNVVRENIRCRSCLIVDGYTKEEEICRHCGEKLFKGDVL